MAAEQKNEDDASIPPFSDRNHMIVDDGFITKRNSRLGAAVRNDYL
jgi:hypothetical protein